MILENAKTNPLSSAKMRISWEIGGIRSTLTRASRLSLQPESDKHAARPVPRENEGEEALQKVQKQTHWEPFDWLQ
ncbi:MAG TPA: hypothetical protein VKV03_11430 [Candidatus Binataceae bacterium]|nr:hypothetical protein [Candidatus Binataceae bacterium]